jgi:hypothetical protein
VGLFFDLNNVIDREVDALFAWKNALKTNGMSIVESGDGSGGTFSGLSGGDILQVASSVEGTANNIGNTRAWFRGKWPNGREMVWQHGNAVNQGGGHLRYSVAAGFLGVGDGAPAASVAPTATDQQFVLGSSITSNFRIFNTALNTGTGLPADNIGRSVLHMCFGGLNEDYAWYALSWIRGNREMRGGMFMDSLTNSPSNVEDGLVVGIIGDEDVSQAVDGFWMDGRVDGTPDTSNQRMYAWAESVYDTASPGIGFENKMLSCYMMAYGHGSNPGLPLADPTTPANGQILGVSPWHGGYDVYGPAQYFVSGRNDTDRGRTVYLGESRLFRVVAFADAVRDMSDDLNWRLMGSIAIPWDGVTGQVLV